LVGKRCLGNVVIDHFNVFKIIIDGDKQAAVCRQTTGVLY